MITGTQFDYYRDATSSVTPGLTRTFEAASYGFLVSPKAKPVTYGWTTDLWDKQQKSWANAKLNLLQGVARRTKSSRRLRRVELEMLWLADVIRGCE